jgi:hypothetical protein
MRPIAGQICVSKLHDIPPPSETSIESRIMGLIILMAAVAGSILGGVILGRLTLEILSDDESSRSENIFFAVVVGIAGGLVLGALFGFGLAHVALSK